MRPRMTATWSCAIVCMTSRDSSHSTRAARSFSPMPAKTLLVRPHRETEREREKRGKDSKTLPYSSRAHTLSKYIHTIMADADGAVALPIYRRLCGVSPFDHAQVAGAPAGGRTRATGPRQDQRYDTTCTGREGERERERSCVPVFEPHMGRSWISVSLGLRV